MKLFDPWGAANHRGLSRGNGRGAGLVAVVRAGDLGSSHGCVIGLSGAISILLGVMVLANIWPSAAVLLGVVPGITLLSNVGPLLTLRLAGKRLV